jgi:murein DD-endopeptidase MepM/ murein hydrolase activator NlpD
MKFSWVAAAVWAVLPLNAAAGGPLQISTESRAQQPGEVVLVTVKAEEPLDALTIHIFNEDHAGYRVAPGTWDVLVGIDLDVPPGSYTLATTGRSANGPVTGSALLKVLDKKFPTRRLTVDENFVNPPASVTDRIIREARELDDTWKRSTPARLWEGPFIRPVPQEANSRFGSRSIYNGQPRSPHGGADFLSPAGTPIKSPNAGRVVIARDLYYTGNTIVIDHGLGLFSVFAHLSEMNVHAGDTVETGEILGTVGATGRVTGPHLHWGLRLDGARVDPLSLLAVVGG